MMKCVVSSIAVMPSPAAIAAMPLVVILRKGAVGAVMDTCEGRDTVVSRTITAMVADAGRECLFQKANHDQPPQNPPADILAGDSRRSQSRGHRGLES